MASPVGTQNSDVALNFVLELLRQEPFLFSFFQAVHLLECAMPERAPVGHFGDPGSESVRFLQNPSLAFPASEIQQLHWAAPKPARMTVNFLGLVGPLGLLPLHYTEMATDRLRAHDRSFLEFLDIFHHRATSHFYRAWEKHQFAIGYERNRNDALTGVLYDLVGLNTQGLRHAQQCNDETFLFYGGFFAMQARGAVILESLLSDYFDVPVAVEQFVGTWRRLDVSDQCHFENEFSGSVQLGAGAVVGDEIWDRQSRARIVLGPLTAQRYREFLPNGRAFDPLRTLIRMFSGDTVEYELQLILQREQVAQCALGSDDNDGIQLGWFTWMKSHEHFDRDPGDTVLLLT